MSRPSTDVRTDIPVIVPSVRPDQRTTPVPFPPRELCSAESEPERLTDDTRRAAYEQVLARFAEIDAEIKVEAGSLTDNEKMYLSKECFLRALVADNWDPAATILRLKKTLAWRKDFGVWDIDQMARDTEPESISGKFITFSYTSSSRPIMFLTPSKNTTDPSELSIKNMVFVMERALELMVAGVERVVFHLDMGGTIQRRPGAIGLWKDQLAVFRTYYPERMGHAYVTSFPWMTRILVTLIWPFVDAKTQERVIFDTILGEQKEVVKAIVQKEYGGDVELAYNRDVYLTDLIKICKERRAATMARWKRLGGIVGLSEKDFRLTAEEAETLHSGCAQRVCTAGLNRKSRARTLTRQQ